MPISRSLRRFLSRSGLLRVLSFALTLMLLLEGAAFPARTEEIAAEEVPAGVRQLLSRLESAANRNDIGDILECYEPSIMKAFSAVFKLSGVENADAIIDLLPMAGPIMNAVSSPPTCQITPLSYKGDEFYGNVKYHTVFTYQDSDRKDAFDQTMSVKNVNGTWYIAAQQSVAVNVPKQPIDPVVPPDVTRADFEKGISYVVSHRDSYTPASKLTRYDFVNPDGKVLFFGYYQDVGSHTANYVWVKRDNRWGVVDCAGRLLLKYTYQNVDTMRDGYYKVYGNGNFRGMINLEKGESLPCVYQDIGIPNEGYVPVKKDGYWGVVDVGNNTAVDFIYADMNDTVRQGRIGAAINDSWGIVAMDGTPVVPLSPQWTGVDLHSNGTYSLRKAPERSWVYFNAAGEKVFADKDGDLVSLSNGYFLWYKGERKNDVYLYNVEADWAHEEIKIEGFQLYDANGKLLVDFLKIAEAIVTDIRYIFVSPAVYKDQLVMGVCPKEGLTYYNLIDMQGKLCYENWIRADEYYGRSKDVYKFGIEKTPIVLYRDTLYEFSTEAGMPKNIVPVYDRYSRPELSLLGDHMVFLAGSAGTHPCIYDLNEKKAYPFYRVKHYPNRYDNDRSTLEVSDSGVFVGLMTHQGILGKGISYTKVNINGDTAELEYGSNKLSFYLGSNGTAYQQVDGKNVPVDIQPLTGGVPIAGTKLALRGETPVETPAPTPTAAPTAEPTAVPTAEPTVVPTAEPTVVPTAIPVVVPTTEPTAVPAAIPVVVPTIEPTVVPTAIPVVSPMIEPAAVPTEQPREAEDAVRIVCGEEEQAVLYQGPGTHFKPLASYPDGTPVRVILFDGDWAYVIIGDGNGFLESRFLSAFGQTPQATAAPVTPLPVSPVQPVFPPAPTSAPAQQFPETGGDYPREAATNIKKVNVRAGTSTESQRVRQLAAPGTGVTVLGEARSTEGTMWYFVQLDTGETGYIRGDLLTFADGSAASYGTFTVLDADQDDFKTVYAALVPGTNSSAYSGPGEYYLRGAEGKAYMAASDTVYLYGRENGWLLVQYSVSPSQWRFAYVRDSVAASPETVAPLQFQWMPATVSWDSVITDDPLHSLSPLSAVSAGSAVYFLARLDSWAYIEYGGIRGFVPYLALSFGN